MINTTKTVIDHEESNTRLVITSRGDIIPFDLSQHEGVTGEEFAQDVNNVLEALPEVFATIAPDHPDWDEYVQPVFDEGVTVYTTGATQ